LATVSLNVVKTVSIVSETFRVIVYWPSSDRAVGANSSKKWFYAKIPPGIWFSIVFPLKVYVAESINASLSISLK